MLGESWAQASEAMMEVSEYPDRLKTIRRRNDSQPRLFDTGEMSASDDQEGADVPEPVSTD